METPQLEDRWVVGEGEWASEATTLAQPDRHEGQCGGDWGFETRHRHSLTRGHRHSASETALGEVDDADTRSHNRHHRRQSTVSWERLERGFHFHTTRLKRFPSLEGSHFDRPWRLPDRRQRPPRRTVRVVEWEFSLTIPGNCPVSAQNRPPGKIPWIRSNSRVSTVRNANALYREKSV